MLPSNTAQTRKETYGLPFFNKQDRESLPAIGRSWIQGFLPFDMEKRKNTVIYGSETGQPYTGWPAGLMTHFPMRLGHVRNIK